LQPLGTQLKTKPNTGSVLCIPVLVLVSHKLTAILNPLPYLIPHRRHSHDMRNESLIGDAVLRSKNSYVNAAHQCSRQ
jgi:hypothetical protein